MKYDTRLLFQGISRVYGLLALVFLPVLISAGDKADSFAAPGFSNPNVLAPVPKNWKFRPIRYTKKDMGADLVVALGQQSHPIFHKLIASYAKKNGLKIVIKQGTCGITAGRLLKKSVDIGAYCCPPGKNDRLPGLKFHSLGISAIALIVHPDNPLTNITTKQARKIFGGQISRWTQIKAAKSSAGNRLIHPVGRLHCKIRPGHWRLLLKNEDLFSPRLFEVGVIPDVISQVARNASAIGYEVPLMVEHHRKRGKVRMLKIDGHAPTELDYVLAGKYPIYRSYNLTSWTKNNKTNRLALKLIRYLQKHIEEIHSKISYVPPSQLKKAGWKFYGDELIGKPNSSRKARR